MAKRNKIRVLLLGAIFLMFFSMSSIFAGHPDSPIKPEFYSFGVVPQFEQRKLVAIWQPILDELERRTKLKFKLSGSPRISSFDKKVAVGEFDFVYMNPYLLSKYQHENYRPLIRDGGRVLEGIIVVHKDSPIKTIQDLKDNEIVFPAPNALAGSLLIRQELNEIHNISIKPLYAQTHSSVYLHIAKGLAVAGGGVSSTLAAQKPHIRNNLRVLYRTRSLPPHPIASHGRVPAAHHNLVKKALLDLAGTDKGRHLMSAIPINEPVKSDIGDYTPVMALDFNHYLEPN